MNASETEVMNRLTEALTRVGSTEDARRNVLELLSEHMDASSHLADLDKLARGVLDDIRHGPLFNEKHFSRDLNQFIWCNPVLPHLPYLRDQWIFRQREIVGNALWYQSTYYNEFFRPYNHDDSVVMMFQRSRYGFASVRPKNEPTPPKTLRFLKYLHPLIENGLLNLKQWDDRWLCAGAVQHLADATQEAIAAVRHGKLLAATGPARTILGLAEHGETSNVWLTEFLSRVKISEHATTLSHTGGRNGENHFAGADGRQYRLSILSAPYADDGGVLMARMTPVLALARPAADIGNRARDLGLSEREAKVMTLAAQGMGAKQIANTLGMAYNTARAHLRNAYAKLGVSNRVEAANRLSADSISN